MAKSGKRKHVKQSPTKEVQRREEKAPRPAVGFKGKCIYTPEGESRVKTSN